MCLFLKQELQTTSHFLLTASRGWCRSQFTHLPGAACLLLPCTFSRCVSTFISSEHLYLCKVYYTVCMSIGPLTGIWSRHFGLQFLDLFNQQRDVLQQVFVLEEQLVDASLGLQPSRGLCTQLVLQEMDLQQKMWGVKSLLTSREKWILCNERGKPNPAHRNIFSQVAPLIWIPQTKQCTASQSVWRPRPNCADLTNTLFSSEKSAMRAVCRKYFFNGNKKIQKVHLHALNGSVLQLFWS